MAKITYEQAKKDHDFLWSIGAAYDMTGGYTDSEDLEKMLNTPTKMMAAKCLSSQIDYWFQAGCESDDRSDWHDLIVDYPELEEIAERYGRL